MITTTVIYQCSRCKQIYDHNDVVNDSTRSVTLDYRLLWVKNVSTAPNNVSKFGTVNMCNPCTDSLITWFQDNGIED